MNPEFCNYIPEEELKKFEQINPNIKKDNSAPQNKTLESAETENILDEFENKSINRIQKEIPQDSLKDNLDYETSETELREKRARNITNLLKNTFLRDENLPVNWTVDGTEEDIEKLKNIIVNSKFNISENKERNAEILFDRYGIVDGKPKTLKKTAQNFNLSTANIRKITLRTRQFLLRSHKWETPVTDRIGYYKEVIDESNNPEEINQDEIDINILREIIKQAEYDPTQIGEKILEKLGYTIITTPYSSNALEIKVLDKNKKIVHVSCELHE